MITTHILDTTRGCSAAGIAVTLEIREPDGSWRALAHAIADEEGRVRTLLVPGTFTAGAYRLTFDTGAYFPDGIYPEVAVTFSVRDASQHYHIPLLLNPCGYTTYRGS